MKEKLGKIYEMIQNLQLQPTKHNVNLIAASLQLLSEVYDELADEDPEDGGEVSP